jgi:hypothetical protein
MMKTGRPAYELDGDNAYAARRMERRRWTVIHRRRRDFKTVPRHSVTAAAETTRRVHAAPRSEGPVLSVTTFSGSIYIKTNDSSRL